MHRLKVKRFTPDKEKFKYGNYAQISPSDYDALDLSNEKALLITGKKTTAVNIIKSSNRTSKNTIWLNQAAEYNSRTNINGHVSVQSKKVNSARRVALSNISKTNLRNYGESGIKEKIKGEIVYTHDILELKSIDGFFQVLKKQPDGPVRISDVTELNLTQFPSNNYISRGIHEAQRTFDKTISRRNDLQNLISQQIQLSAVSLGLYLTSLSLIYNVGTNDNASFSINPSNVFIIIPVLIILLAVSYSFYQIRKNTGRNIGLSATNIDSLLFNYSSIERADLQRIENYTSWIDRNTKENNILLNKLTLSYIFIGISWIIIFIIIILELSSM